MPLDFFSKKLLKKTAGQPAPPATTTPAQQAPPPIDVRKEAEKLAAAKRAKGKTLADRMKEMQPAKSR